MRSNGQIRVDRLSGRTIAHDVGRPTPRSGPALRLRRLLLEIPPRDSTIVEDVPSVLLETVRTMALVRLGSGPALSEFDTEHTR